MAIAVADGFQYFGAKPLDSRIKYETTAAMKSVPDANLYEGCIAYCVATDKYYKWLSSNTVDETLGKWREYQSGGGSSYTAGDGIVIDNDEISTDNLQSGDIAECLYPLPTPTPDVISLGGLTDVALTDPQNGETLKYNSTTHAWENGEGGGGGTTYTAGDGINIDANNEISTDNLQSGDMDDVLSTLPGMKSRYNVYSTTEQVVGEWINGKPIYQKTISGQMPNANDTVSIAHGISDLDIVVELDAIAHKPTTHKNFLLPIVGDGYNESYKKQSLISIASDYLYLRNYGDDYSAYTAYITMKYTKTTD